MECRFMLVLCHKDVFLPYAALNRRSTMTLRSLLISNALSFSCLLAFTAQAHDPSLHEPRYVAPQTKAVPTTCTQLADTQRYSNDETNPDIKKLKMRCDAEKTAAARKAKATGDKK
jgi:hypothetical protein